MSVRVGYTLRGSSPRVRGRLAYGFVAGQDFGLIPAGAGQIKLVWCTDDADKAHPRGCGADSSKSSASQLIVGSSPRVRGRSRSHRNNLEFTRLIPAGAGQIRWGERIAPDKAAHPRGCGADYVACAKETLCSGSSPRVRGRLQSA